MEEYPYLQKTCSSVQPYQESAAIPEKSFITNPGMHGHYYASEALIPATSIPSNSYSYENSTASLNNAASDNRPGLVSTSETYNQDLFGSSVAPPYVQQYVAPQEYPQHAPLIISKPAGIDPMHNQPPNFSTPVVDQQIAPYSALVSVPETAMAMANVCDVNSHVSVNAAVPAPDLPGSTCLPLESHGEEMKTNLGQTDAPMDKSVASTVSKLDVKPPPSNDAEIGEENTSKSTSADTNTLEKDNGDIVSSHVVATKDEMEQTPSHRDDSNGDSVLNHEAFKHVPTSKDEESAEASSSVIEKELNNTPTETHPVTSNCDSVSSLFKNVVFVHADTIDDDGTDSETVTASDGCPLNGTSDDLNPVPASSVEDIGREDEPMDNGSLDTVALLVDETGDIHNYETMEGIDVGKIGHTVAVDAPMIDPNEEPDGLASDENEEHAEGDNCSDATESDAEANPSDESIGTHDELDSKNRKNAGPRVVRQKASVQKKAHTTSSVSSSGSEKQVITLSTDEEGRCTDDRSSRRSQKRKHSERTSESNIKPQGRATSKRRKSPRGSQQSNDDPFGSWSSSSSEDISNDMYFGSRDRVFTVSTKLHWQPQKKKGKTRTRDTTSEDSDDEAHVRRVAKKAEEIARLDLPAYQQQQLQKLLLKKQPKRDRFYDRSQDIPNDIYFGNVKVPLHILHATSSSSSDEESWPKGNVKPSSRSYLGTKAKHASSTHSKDGAKHSKSPQYYFTKNASSKATTINTQTSNRSIQRMKEYLKIAGFRHVRYQKLWQDCHSTQDRANAILRLLQEHGLQGEPTEEKCRELRKQIQLQKEVEVLDTSVIIDGGEGRVTRQRTKKVSETNAGASSVSVPSDVRRTEEKSVPLSAVEEPQEQAIITGQDQAEKVLPASPSGECISNSSPLAQE